MGTPGVGRRPAAVVLVTGAAGGLGSAVAARFARDGATVACVDVHREQAQAVVVALRSGGAEALAFSADVSSEDEVEALRRSVHAQLGTIDVLVNAHGILSRESLAELDARTFRRVLDVNLTGTFLLTRAFADDLRASAHGRVVNVASIAGVGGYDFPAYAASKAGVINLTRSLVLEFWGSGVTVNAVCPGAMRTAMMDAQAEAQFNRRTPSGRIAEPEDVAAAIAYLAAPDSACVNGAVLIVDGGATAAFRYAQQ